MRTRFLPAVLVALSALPAWAGFKDGVFTSAEHGARFKLPKGSTVDTGNTSDGKVVLFQSEDGELKGVLRHVKEGMGAAKHAKWRGAEWEKKGALVTWESEEKVAGKEGDWVKVVLELEAGEDEMKSAHLFVSKGKDDFELAVMVKAGDWEKSAKVADEILASLEFGEFKEEAGDDGTAPGDPKPAGGGAGDGKEVLLPNPWEGCGKGSWAKYRMVTEAAGTKTEMEMTTTLVDFDEESYTVKTDMVMAGNAIPGQETKIDRRQKTTGGEAPKTEEGDETVKVAKGEMACHWVKTTTDQGWSQSWTSAEVPGRTVKLLAEHAGSKSEMELLDYEKK